MLTAEVVCVQEVPGPRAVGNECALEGGVWSRARLEPGSGNGAMAKQEWLCGVSRWVQDGRKWPCELGVVFYSFAVAA